MSQMASGEESISFGHYLVKGKSRHAMEDYHVAEIQKVKVNEHEHELGLFAIYDGHLGHNVADYLQQNLFTNILNEVISWYISLLQILRAACSTAYMPSLSLGRLPAGNCRRKCHVMQISNGS